MRRSSSLLALAVLTVTLAACSPPENAQPMCHAGPPAALMAESVPAAAFVPCVRSVPDGWRFEGFAADEREATFSLARDAGGVAEVTLRRRCDPAGGDAVASSHARIREARDVSPDGRSVTWTSAFSGGCVILEVRLAIAGESAVAEQIHDAISFLPRASVRAA